MTLNTIELPQRVIAELYRNSLLASDEPSQAVRNPAEKPSGKQAAEPVRQSGTPAAVPTKSSVQTAPEIAPPHTPQPVTISREQPVETVPTSVPYKFLGNNGKKITIVVASPGIAYLPDDQLAFLAKMLEACKMNMGDVALVNHASSPVVIATLKAQLEPGTLVLFGIEPVGIRLPINFPQFKIQPYDGCNYLYSPSLEELVKPTEEGKLLKSKLWVCLKTLFNI